MPLPMPHKGQSQDDWISACMGHEMMLSEYPDQKQRLAVCHAQWKRRDVPPENAAGLPGQAEVRRAPTATFRAEQSETDFRPIVRGYPIVWDRLSEDLGGWRERIMPGAFDRTLREGIDVRALINHDTSKPVGRLSAGTLRLKVDSQGVFSEIDLPNTSAARDVAESMRRGDVTGGSFAFRTISDDWRLEDGVPTRLLLDMRVSEVSIGVVMPAYSETDLAVARRSLDGFLRTTRPTLASLRDMLAVKMAAWR